MPKVLRIILLSDKEIEELLNALTGIKYDNRAVQKVKERLRTALQVTSYNSYDKQEEWWKRGQK